MTNIKKLMESTVDAPVNEMDRTQNAPDARRVTNKLIGMVRDGLQDKDTVIVAALNYLCEDEVQEMAEDEGFFLRIKTANLRKYDA